MTNRILDAIMPVHTDGVVYTMFQVNVGFVLVTAENRDWCDKHQVREYFMGVAAGQTCPIHGELECITAIDLRRLHFP